MAKEEGITVKKDDDMAEWYSQVVVKSELADYSPVKGCMIIRPRGYAIWQKIQDYFNARLKELKVENAYFPLFIPESFFKKEAEHAEGFSPEVAWIANKEEGEEKLAIRPTSETIMYDSYSKWIRSYRDLPLRINQWCNVVRWETKATKLFLRSREFLWQEGHCVYETNEECDRETKLFLEEYKKLAEDILAIPVLVGIKTEKEKFAGALYTTTIEAFMPDGKALQLGTSHNLGQNFANAFGIKYKGKDGNEHYPWQNSWGFSTRLLGGLVMAHSDNKGLVLPPKIAPLQIIIIPILFDETRDKVLEECEKVKEMLKDFDVEIDARDEYSPGWKYNDWELKGVPIRIEIGPKDIAEKHVVLVRRDNSKKETVKIHDLKEKVEKELEDIQENLFNKAKKFLDHSIVKVEDMDKLKKVIEDKKIAKTYFCGNTECEDWIKDITGGASSRCIPFDESIPKGKKCVYCGKEAKHLTYFSKSY